MDNFARRAAAYDDDVPAFMNEAAARRDVTPIIIEKDFWVCWTLRRLMETPGLGEHLTFKGGTSLSKAYGIIDRFSEDIDLTIGRSAPQIEQTKPPMENGISRKERGRRAKILKAAAQAYVRDTVMPALEAAIEEALGARARWTMMLDPEDGDAQTILFEYPRLIDYGAFSSGGFGEGVFAGGYIKPRIKLEFGARGETEPSLRRTITPYLAAEYPDELPNADVVVSTLSVERTFWEKVTILHALHHGAKMQPAMSRHYYDTAMLTMKGVDDLALLAPELLAKVVVNKSLMFADNKASYGTAVLGSLRLAPTDELRTQLRADYEAMREMFMAAPPTFDDMMASIASLEEKLNQRSAPLGQFPDRPFR